MPIMSASSAASAPSISVERITGSIYELDAGEPTSSLVDGTPGLTGTPDAPEGARGLLFPLHCYVPVLQDEYICATLRNNTGQKVSLCVLVQGTSWSARRAKPCGSVAKSPLPACTTGRRSSW